MCKHNVNLNKGASQVVSAFRKSDTSINSIARDSAIIITEYILHKFGVYQTEVSKGVQIELDLIERIEKIIKDSFSKDKSALLDDNSLEEIN